MRLWHDALLPVLPRKQLVAQLRECVAIAGKYNDTGTPNHVLVNKILDFPLSHFRSYCREVIDEMQRRGYKVSDSTFKKLTDYIGYNPALVQEHRSPFRWIKEDGTENYNDLSKKDWFTDRYLIQCLANLQEKYDCGVVPGDEWKKIVKWCINSQDPELFYFIYVDE